ncbi:MAG TPA: MerR family transcriptional regulator [Candidatus Limnocylindrales bacterium]|nr:MerR family transcriptional regulator [Candidatus Limnocylindrales bacterium]
MYNIKQAAARAGISVPVLRAWERRYGIVHPERSASGYRRFDEASVARVRTMRGLVDDGWSPSAAAAAILAGDVPITTARPVPGEAAGAPAGSGTALRPADEIGADLAARLVTAAAGLDAVAVETVLDELFSRGSFERVTVDYLFPALERLGVAWAAGEVSVAGEHLASAAVHRRIAMALEAAASPGDGPRIVVGLPPGSRHELGALAFAVVASRAGLAVAYLGPDLPVDDWVAAAAGSDATVIGVVTRRDRRPALEVVRAILAAGPTSLVAFGGAAAPDEPGVLVLPAALPDAVASLRAALAGGGR